VAAFVITNPVIVFSGTDISDHVTSVSIDDSVADIDTTNMASSGNHTRTGGLKDGSISIEMQNDFAASSIDSLVWANRGSLVTITVKATSSATSATNPLYSGSYLVNQYKLGGKVGDLSMVSVTWPRSGALTRSTS
jgi:hypothetical protein